MKILSKTKKLPVLLAACLLLLSILGLAGCSNTKSGMTNGTGATGTPTSYGTTNSTGSYTSNGTGYTGNQNRYGTNGSYGTTGANSLTTDLTDVGRDINNSMGSGVNNLKNSLSADM